MSMLRVYDPKKGKEVTVGEIHKDAFIKRTGPAHYMRKYRGYGISKIVIEKLAILNIEHIIIRTMTEEYTAPLITWISEGTIDDFGHGEQIFLGVAKMRKK